MWPDTSRVCACHSFSWSNPGRVPRSPLAVVASLSPLHQPAPATRVGLGPCGGRRKERKGGWEPWCRGSKGNSGSWRVWAPMERGREDIEISGVQLVLTSLAVLTVKILTFSNSGWKVPLPWASKSSPKTVAPVSPLRHPPDTRPLWRDTS